MTHGLDDLFEDGYAHVRTGSLLSLAHNYVKQGTAKPAFLFLIGHGEA
jgi:hypothetical protein